MKRFSIAAVAFLAAAFALRADETVYYSCDFDNGMPADISVEDGDGAKLHFLMIQAGFDQGDSWKVMRDKSTSNGYAASPSMHSDPSVRANDRMTLPPVLIRAADAVLTWRCRSIDEQGNSESTYSIVVNGKEVVSSAKAPAKEWAEASVSLGDFAGKRVSITFVNNTLNGEVLAIDDIAVAGSSGIAAVTPLPGPFQLGSEATRLGAAFTATSSTPVTSVSLACEIDGTTYIASASGLNLKAGEQTELYIDKPVNIEFGSTVTYTLLPTVNGEKFDPIACATTALAFLPKKRTVVEEGTGDWCGWCPLGIVATDSLVMYYGTDIIPIAVHYDGYDPMAMPDYKEAMKLDGAPYGLFDRTVKTTTPLVKIRTAEGERYTMERGGFGTIAAERQAIIPCAEINIEVTPASSDDDFSTALIHTSTRWAKAITEAHMRIVLVMTEDNVWGKNYYQSNYLYAEDCGPIGGFESMPAKITEDFTFNHVARAVAEDAYFGIEGSVPADIAAGEVTEFDYSWPIPSSVHNPRMVTIAAILVDATTGQAVNAASAPLDPSNTALHTVNAAHALPAAAEYYTLQGIRVSAVSLSPGLYIVKKGAASEKILVR